MTFALFLWTQNYKIRDFKGGKIITGGRLSNQEKKIAGLINDLYELGFHNT